MLLCVSFVRVCFVFVDVRFVLFYACAFVVLRLRVIVGAVLYVC